MGNFLSDRANESKPIQPPTPQKSQSTKTPNRRTKPKQAQHTHNTTQHHPNTTHSKLGRRPQHTGRAQGAVAAAGVRAVLLADDVPGRLTYGLKHADQPVLAAGQVRYMGEPVAVVAVDHPKITQLGVRYPK